MKLTKYQHACFTVEKDGQVLVIDPGEFSADFIAPSGVVGIVITHEHSDHFDSEQLAAIFDKNDNVLVLGPPDVARQVEVENKRAVVAGDHVTVGPFELEFFGGDHAVIRPGQPIAQNVGVMIDELLYYPGDSFAEPGRAVDTLALPVSAPWMKVSEGMAFLQAVRPRLAFPTHDAILSGIGQSMVDRMFGGVAKAQETTYQRLSESIEI